MLPRQTKPIRYGVPRRCRQAPGPARSPAARDGKTDSRTIRQIEITIEPQTAVQKPSTWKPRSSPSAMALVSMSISALITISIRPSVSTISGSESSRTIGRTKEVISPKIAPTTSSVTAPSTCCSRPA